MQVFHNGDIVHDESVAVVKFRAWWHFVVSLKDKATALFAEVFASCSFIDIHDFPVCFCRVQRMYNI